LTYELAEDERYRTLFGIVAEPPDDYRDENGIPMGYYRSSYSEEETSEEKDSSDEETISLRRTISSRSNDAAS
jgi:hypothetical protein